MRLSTFRPSLIAWLNRKLIIHSWELKAPEEVGKTNAFLPPLRSMEHYESESGRSAKGTQEIYLTTRYSRDVKYADLPLNFTEGVYSTICQLLLSDYQSIADLVDLNINMSDQAIQVTEQGDKYGDWIITMVIYARIVWVPERERPPAGGGGIGVNPDPVLPNIIQIDTGIFREHLDGNSRIKDYDGKFELG
jgi:hypothetical protein